MELDIEILTHIICSYLNRDECCKYVTFLNKQDIYPYLYMTYDDNYIPKNLKSIRHINLFWLDNITHYENLISMNCKINNNNMDETHIPKTLNSIIFDKQFNKPIKLRSFENLTSITFNNNFNQPITLDTLPPNLYYLKFGNRCGGQIFSGAIPTTCKTIIFGSGFNQKIVEGIIPNEVEVLEFGTTFKQQISWLPNMLVELTFGARWNEQLHVGILPNTLRILRFGKYYNHEIKKYVLNDGLEQLFFGTYYQKYIGKNVLPDTLQTIGFLGNFRHGVYLPNSIKEIILTKGDINDERNLQSYTMQHPNAKIICSKDYY